MDTVHNNADPVHLASNHNRLLTLSLRIREQELNILNAMLNGALLQAAQALSVLQGISQNLGMNNGITLGSLIKSIEFHTILPIDFVGLLDGIFLVFVPSIYAGVFQSLANNSVDNSLLLVGHRIKDVGNGLILFLSGSHGFTLLTIGFRVFRVFFSMVKLQLFTKIEDCLADIVPMSNNVLDKCFGISTRNDKANLLDLAVNHIRTLLPNLIRTDGHRVHVTALDKNFTDLTIRRIVKLAISVNTFRAIKKKCVTKNVCGISMVVIPYKRNFISVVIFKSITTDHTTIAATAVIPCRPATKIVIHFDLYSSFLVSSPSASSPGISSSGFKGC